MRILGVDPGTVHVGYALIDHSNRAFASQDYGCLKVPKNRPFPEKLLYIHTQMVSLIQTLVPDVIAVEDVYVNCNARTSLKLGHARGVILLAASQKQLPVEEYAPREIKQAVVGRGNATKDQVMWMVRRLLNISEETLKPDTADALAIALCCGMRQKMTTMGIR